MLMLTHKSLLLTIFYTLINKDSMSELFQKYNNTSVSQSQWIDEYTKSIEHFQGLDGINEKEGKISFHFNNK